MVVNLVANHSAIPKLDISAAIVSNIGIVSYEDDGASFGIKLLNPNRSLGFLCVVRKREIL